jgi:hypothetical protein
VDALGYGVVFSVPGKGGVAFNDAMRVASKAHCATWEGSVGVPKCPGFFVWFVIGRCGGGALLRAKGTCVVVLVLVD